jgi:hypothetical protein
MKVLRAIAVSLALLGTAQAQTAPEKMVGTWIGKTAICGDSVIIIKSVEAGGGATGTYECKNRNQGLLPFGPQLIQGKQAGGKFDGKNFSIETTIGFYVRVALEGDNKMTGQMAGGPGTGTPVTFVKQ